MPPIAPPSVPAHAPNRVHAQRSRWIAAVTIGEALGFAVAATVAVGSIGLAAPDPWRYLLFVAGGAAEGAVLGGAQIIGMGARRPDARGWVGATALGAAVAWSIGILPSTLDLPLLSPLGILTLAVGAVALLASLPVAQWLVIRRRPRAATWIPVNMGAWAVGILWTFAPSPFVDETTPVGVAIAIYCFAGLLMAGTVAALTSGAAHRLFS